VTADGGTVLVVDDDPVNRAILQRGLERQGHRVRTAEDGRQAVEMLASEPVDVVLLDVLMPEMDGYAVLERMKADDRLRDIPVVVVSALDEMESVVRCIEMGAEDYLPKPFDPTLLRARINAGLAKKRLRDLEAEYLEQVGHVVEAAAAVEAGTFDPGSLDPVARRDDALGNLARVFLRMAREVLTREERLQREVQQLRIEIDGARAARKVQEITETDYFKTLERKVADLRLKGGG
jgi:two-component system, cell cycle response regulator